MNYIFDFSLYIDALPSDAFRLTYLDSQNDGTSQDYVFHLKCFSAESYDISSWGLMRANIYYKNKHFRTGLLISGKAYEKDFEGYFYEFSLSSPISFFKTRGPNRVFVNKSADQIINTVFETAGWKAHQWHWDLKNSLPVLPYVVQYHQSDYDFILGLLAEFKLNFEFELNLLKLSDKLFPHHTIHHVEEPQPYDYHTTQAFLGYQYEKPNRAGLFTAKIEAYDQIPPYPTLNHEGYYYIRFPFDQSSELLHGSSPVPLISPHFMHFPLRSGTEVAVRFIEGNMRQPVLIGVIAEHLPEPENYKQTSYAGHELWLNPGQLKMSHSNAENFICLADNIVMTAGLGQINWRSAQKTLMYSQGNHTQDIYQDQKINIKNNHTVKTIQGDIILTSGGNAVFSSEHELMTTSSENMALTGNNIQLYSENFNIMTQEKLNINNTEKCELFSQRITTNSQANLSLNVNGVGLLGTAGGIVFNAPTLVINALQIVGIQMM